LTKSSGPVLAPAALGPVDAVLVSHDQHPDNLDRLGRDYLAGVPLVLPTASAKARLGGTVRSLPNWQETKLRRPGGCSCCSQASASPFDRDTPSRPAWFGAMFHVEQGRAWQAPGRPGAPTTTPEAAMRYRVTWNVEVDADDEGQARTAARQFLLENEDEALSKVVALEDGSAPPDVPKVDAGGTPAI
jgi:hypothetical protein